MKAKFALVIAIIMAIAMVTPTVAVLNDSDSSAAESSMPSFSPTDILDSLGISTEGLKDIVIGYATGTALPAEDQDITTDLTVASGEIFVLEKNYNFTDGTKITFESGSYLVLCTMQDFSLISEGYGGIVMKEGSHTAIMTTVPTTVAEITAGAAQLDEVDDDDSYFFSGTVVYDVNTDNDTSKTTVDSEAAFTVSNGFKMRDAAAEADMTAYLETTEECKIAFSVDMFYGTSATAAIDFTLTANLAGNLKANITKDGYDTGSFDIDSTTTASAEVPMDATAATDLTGTVKTDNTVKVSYTSDGVTVPVTITANGSLDVFEDDFSTILVQIANDSTKAATYLQAAEFVLTGTVEGKVVVDNFSEFDAEGGVVTMEGMNVNFSANIGEEETLITVGVGASKIAVAPDESKEGYEEGGVITDISASITVGIAGSIADLIPTGESSSNPMVAIYNIIANSYGGTWAKLSEEDFAKLTTEDFNKQATTAVLGYVNPLIAMVGGPEISQLGADISIGSISLIVAETCLMDVRDVSLSLDLNETDGLLVEAGVGYAHVSVAVGSSMVVDAYLKNAKVTVTNSQTQGEFLDITVTGDASVRIYTGGVLQYDFYVQGVSTKLQTPLTYSAPELKDFSVGTLSMVYMGVGFDFEGITYDETDEVVDVDSINISGDYYGVADIMAASGTIYDAVISSDGTMTIGSANLSFTDYEGDILTVSRSINDEGDEITNAFSSTGPFWADEITTDSVFGAIMALGFTNESATTLDTYFAFYGTVIFNDANFSETGVGASALKGEFYVSSMDANGNDYGMTTFVMPDGTTYGLTFTGCALGFDMKDDGTVDSYKVAALPGYTATSTGLVCNNMSVDENLVATITDISDFSCAATPGVYSITIDGELITDAAVVGAIFEHGVESDVVALVNANGATVGTVALNGLSNKIWSYQRASGDEALVLTTVKSTTISDVVAGENKVSGNAVSFTVPDLSSGSASIVFENGLRFDLTDSALTGKAVDMIAQATTYNGKTAYIVKVLNDNSAVASVFYIPVDGVNNKLMHVDEYGRTSTLATNAVTIDGQTYLKVALSDYSILYTETDNPVITPDSNSSDYTMIIIAAVAIVAVVALVGAVFFLRKRAA